MKQAPSGRSFLTFLAGIVVGILGYQRLDRVNERVAERVRVDADRKLLDLVVPVIARRVQIPAATLYRVIENPAHNPDAYQALLSTYRTCSIIFMNSGGTSLSASVEIGWADGASTIIETTWPWDRLPLEVRRELLRKNQPVKINWQLPIAEQTIHSNGSI